MKGTVVIALNVGEEHIKQLGEAFPGWEFCVQPHHGGFDEELVARADIVACQGNRDMIRNAKNARWIHTFSAGVDGLVPAILECHPQGIPLSNSSGVYGIPIAEHSLALMMALSRRLDVCVRQMSRPVWQFPGPAREMRASTVGILGCGDIGGHLAHMVKGLGARVLGFKRTGGNAQAPFDALYNNDTLDDMLPLCDYLAVCLPGTAHTRGLLDARRLAMVKPGVIITNIGRGHIIDTQALINGLKNGRIGAAGLDVTDPEPLPGDHPLWAMDNVIITPHCSYSSPVDVSRKVALFAQNMKAFLAGEPLPGLVDPRWEY